MANITEPGVPAWADGIYEFATTDQIIGGPDGVDNLPHKQLAARTQWLKKQVDEIYPVIKFGAVGDGVTNDRAALQAAIDYCADRVKNHNAKNIALDLLGRSYFVDGNLQFKGGNDGYSMTIRDGRIIASTLTAWAGAPVFVIGGAYGTGPAGDVYFEKVTVQCNHLASGIAFDLRGGGVVTVNSCDILGAKDYGVMFDDCAFCYVTNCFIQEWGFTESGFTDKANYTSKGVWVKDGATTVSVTNNLIRYCDYTIYNEGPSTRISGNDFDQSGAGHYTPSNPKSVYCSGAWASFNDNYFFFGDIALVGPNGVTSIWNCNRFLVYPSGALPYGSNNRLFNLVATVSSQGLGRFKEITTNNWVTDQVAANTGTYPSSGIVKYHYSTSGGGSWASTPANIP